MIVLISLIRINEDNYREALALKTSQESDDFADTVAYSLAEAWVYYEDTLPFVIYDNDKMIGFVSLYIGDNNMQIINFLIADAFQNQGLGTKAAKICIDYLQKEYNAYKISVPVNPENKIALHFWEKLGFVYSDTIEDGYVFMRLYL